jgi:hypothetical protein
MTDEQIKAERERFDAWFARDIEPKNASPSVVFTTKEIMRVAWLAAKSDITVTDAQSERAARKITDMILGQSWSGLTENDRIVLRSKAREVVYAALTAPKAEEA